MVRPCCASGGSKGRRGWLFPLFCLAFVSGLASASAQGAQFSWPHEVVVGGKAVTVYAPQLQSLTGTALKGRSRVSVEIVKGAKPSVGSAWFTASVRTDKAAKLLRIVGIRIDRTQVPDLSSSEARTIASVIESRVSAAQIVLPLDHVLAALPPSARAGDEQSKASPSQDKTDAGKSMEKPGSEK